MAELSQVFGFLIIFKDSLKLIFKNGKFMAQITLLSLLLPSILLLLFLYINQTLINYATKTLEYSPLQIIPYFTLLLLFEFTSFFAYAKISRILGIATIIVSAASYADTTISFQQLYSKIKTKSNLYGFSGTTSNRGTEILVMVVWMVVFFMAIFHPNPITISIAVVVGVFVFVYGLYSTVPAMLSHVVSIIEEKFDGSEALEKAEELVEGQRQHGFMINLCLNMVVLILFVGFWLVLRGELWSVNVMEFGLVFVNVFCLAMIFVRVAYTVLYFRCKELYRGGDEEVGGGVGSVDYSKLLASDLDGGQ